MRVIILCVLLAIIAITSCEAIRIEKFKRSTVVSKEELSKISNDIQYANENQNQQKPVEQHQQIMIEQTQTSSTQGTVVASSAASTASTEATAPIPSTMHAVKVEGTNGETSFTVKNSDVPQVDTKIFNVKPTILMEIASTQSPAASVASGSTSSTNEEKQKEKKKRRRNRRKAKKNTPRAKLLRENMQVASNPLPETFKPVTVIGADGNPVQPKENGYHVIPMQEVPKIADTSKLTKPVILLETMSSAPTTTKMVAAKVVDMNGQELHRGESGYTIDLAQPASSQKVSIPETVLDSKFKKVTVDASLAPSSAPSHTVLIEQESSTLSQNYAVSLSDPVKATEQAAKALKRRLRKHKKSVKAKIEKLKEETKKNWQVPTVLGADGQALKQDDAGYTQFNDIPRVHNPHLLKPAVVVGAAPSAPSVGHVPFIKNGKGEYVRPALVEVESSSTVASPEQIEALRVQSRLAQQVASQLEAQRSHTANVVEKMNFHSERLSDAINEMESTDSSLIQMNENEMKFHEQKEKQINEAHQSLINLSNTLQAVHEMQSEHHESLQNLSHLVDSAILSQSTDVSLAQIQSYVTQTLAHSMEEISSSSPTMLDHQVKDLTQKMESLTQLLKNKN